MHYTYIYIYMYMYTYTHTCTYTHTFTYTYTCTCTRARAHTHTHTCMHAHARAGVRGGTELGMMSATRKFEVALQYTGYKKKKMPTVFKIGINAVSRGAVLQEFSQYPGRSFALCIGLFCHTHRPLLPYALASFAIRIGLFCGADLQELPQYPGNLVCLRGLYSLLSKQDSKPSPFIDRNLKE